MSERIGQNVFVELHALVSHAPSNLNRDDLGAPKTAVFGGVRRLRISSQCQKRSWRRATLFKHQLAVERERLGERTNKLGKAVLEQLGRVQENALSDVEERGFRALLSSIGKGESSTEEKEKKGSEPDDAGAEDGDDAKEEATETAHLLYLSIDEQVAVAVFVKNERPALAKIGELLRALDLAAADEAAKEAVAKESAAKEPAAKEVQQRGARARSKPTAGGGKGGSAKRDDPKKKEAAEEIDKLRKRLKDHMLAYVPRSAVDVALFGRFLTKSEFREIDAAMQVAHAIGTQRAEVEYDYFTAIDDRSGEAAAGMIGETELGASVFYKYAACDMALLRDNLGPSQAEAKLAEKSAEVRAKVDAHRANAQALAARALKAIAHAMARVVPTGKQNSTAPQSPADYLEVVVRRDAPVSLVNAFLDPVRPDGKQDVMDQSIARLRDRANKYDEMYGAAPVVARFILSSRPLGALARGATRCDSLAELGDKLEKLVAELSA